METVLFVKSREEIEALLTTIDSQIEQNHLKKSKEMLKNASKLIKRLRRATDDVIQLRSASNLDLDIKIIQNRIESIIYEKSAAKEKREDALASGDIRDGNIAIKCNWNDRGYKAPCSKAARQINIINKRTWCSSTLCNFRKYDQDVKLDYDPCYESIALREMCFGAGWNLKNGEKERPRRIRSVKNNRMAILTTIPPGKEESDRLVIGFLYIDEIENMPNEETKIYGNKKKSFEVPFKKIKIRFWDYYKNPKAKKRIIWNSGLFRYLSNRTAISILRGVNNQYSKHKKDKDKIISLIKYYEKIKG